MKYLICDLDGTLSDCSARRGFMEETPKDWKNFYFGIPYDPVNEWCKKILSLFYDDHYKIILMSGRPDTHKQVTLDWLEKHEIKWDELIMRKEGDHRNDNIVKLELFNELKERLGTPLFAIDDRQRIVDMWREQGITCLQCDKGDF